MAKYELTTYKNLIETSKQLIKDYKIALKDADKSKLEDLAYDLATNRVRIKTEENILLGVLTESVLEDMIENVLVNEVSAEEYEAHDTKIMGSQKEFLKLREEYRDMYSDGREIFETARKQFGRTVNPTYHRGKIDPVFKEECEKTMEELNLKKYVEQTKGELDQNVSLAYQ